MPFSDGLDVAMVSSEASPFARSGGLADVCGSLPAALAGLGMRVSLVLPAYRSVLRGGYALEETGIEFQVPVSSRHEPASVLHCVFGGCVDVYFIRAEKYFDRDYLYGPPDGDFADNAERFVFFCRAALGLLSRRPPDIIHAHDWQSALSVGLLKAQPERYPSLSRSRAVFTVHNLGYQGLFPGREWHLLDLDRRFFVPPYLEFYGKCSFIKAGLVFGDWITTVSPGYAAEIKTPEQGFGLEGVMVERADRLTGILNGVDYRVWDPRSDRFLASNYGPGDMKGKGVCKQRLQAYFGLAPDPDVPLVGMVSRLTGQKGFDLIEKAFDALMSRDLQLVILGAGERRYVEFLSAQAERHSRKVAVEFAFDEKLSHEIIAGADIFLMPSLYEPCGLTQMYSLRYGTVPVVRAVGGLGDTVPEFNAGTGGGRGFLFHAFEVRELVAALDRGIAAYHDGVAWARIMTNAMSADFSWEGSARAYAGLYGRLVSGSAPPSGG